jgi:hypothetical protein
LFLAAALFHLASPLPVMNIQQEKSNTRAKREKRGKRRRFF